MANYKLADRTHCNYGHEFTVENTQWRKDGGRVCRECNRARRTRQRANNIEKIREYEREFKRKKRGSVPISDRVRTPQQVKDATRKRTKYQDARIAEALNLGLDRVEELAKKDDDRPSAVWNQLSPKGNLGRAVDRLNAIIDKQATPCKNRPDLFSDYAEAPSAEEALDLCRSCPAIRACYAYGKAEQKAQREKGLELVGIYGGIVIEED